MITDKQRKDTELRFAKYQNENRSKEDFSKTEDIASNLGEKYNDFMLLLKMVKDFWEGKFYILLLI